MQSITHQLPFNEVVFQPFLAHYFSKQLKLPGQTLPIPTCKLGMHCEDFPQVPLLQGHSAVYLSLFPAAGQLSSMSEPQMRSVKLWSAGKISFSNRDPCFYLFAWHLAATSPPWLTLVWGQPKPPGFFFSGNVRALVARVTTVLDECNSFLKNNV